MRIHQTNLTGTISLLDSSAFALKQGNGGAISVLRTSATQVRKGQVTIRFSDLKIGENVAVKGAPSGEGEVQATLVQVI